MLKADGQVKWPDSQLHIAAIQWDTVSLDLSKTEQLQADYSWYISKGKRTTWTKTNNLVKKSFWYKLSNKKINYLTKIWILNIKYYNLYHEKQTAVKVGTLIQHFGVDNIC